MPHTGPELQIPLLEAQALNQFGDPHVLSLIDQDRGCSDISIVVDLSNDEIYDICAGY